MLQRFPRAVLGVLLFINIIGYVDRSMLLGFSPQITHDVGLNNTQFGFLSGAVWVLSYGVMAILCGSLADRHSRPRIIAIGMLIWSLCTAASGLAQSFSHLVAARLLVASGEAALLPAGTALLADLFDQRHRSTINGLFFTGIPLGIGISYLMSGTVGAMLGWRNTFFALGMCGAAIGAVLLFVEDSARPASRSLDGDSANSQAGLRAVLRLAAGNRALACTLIGFTCVHFVIAGSTFVQLWLVRELGADKALMARQLGILQIAFGFLGALGGGLAADRLARRWPGGAAMFPVLSLLVCLPLMITSRFAGPNDVLLYVGLAATAFLPFSVYGPSMTLLQQCSPPRLRSTVVGVAMMSLNIVAIACGTLAAGWVSDRLGAMGYANPLRTVLLWLDGLTALALLSYARAAVLLRQPPAPRN